MTQSNAWVCVGTVLALLSAAGPAMAQDLRVGAQFGISLSTFGGEGIGGLDEHRRGLIAGVTLDYRLASALHAETGAFWIQKGATGTVQGFEEAIPTRVRVSYLQVPLLLRLTPLPAATIRPSIAVGPAVSFETGCDFRSDPSDIAVLVGCDDDARSKTDLGVIFGAGLGFDVGRTALLVEARYDLGLRDLDTIDRVETKNRGFALTTRFTFPGAR
jgi:hypothetical protein